MPRLIEWFLSSALCLSGIVAGRAAGVADSTDNVPNRNTPQKLQEAWLEFHESDLCQEVDSVFVFSGNGLEVWSRIESEKILQKFQGLFEPLKDSYPVELYTTRCEADKRSDEEDDPPPSLWQNLELRTNLGEYIPAIAGRMLEDRLQSKASTMPDSVSPFLKQRLKIYAEQVLNWNKRMERYASDLSLLARAAFAPGGAAAVRSKAIDACASHIQNLDKHIGKLTDNLQLAFPAPERKEHSSRHELPVRFPKDPVEKAQLIATSARSVSQRVFRFVYPENYTVELGELRHPGLLESLNALRSMVSDFKKSLSKSSRN